MLTYNTILKSTEINWNTNLLLIAPWNQNSNVVPERWCVKIIYWNLPKSNFYTKICFHLHKLVQKSCSKSYQNLFLSSQICSNGVSRQFTLIYRSLIFHTRYCSKSCTINYGNLYQKLSKLTKFLSLHRSLFTCANKFKKLYLNLLTSLPKSTEI